MAAAALSAPATGTAGRATRFRGSRHNGTGRIDLAASYNILVLGASYGSLLASKVLFGGHTITLVCRPAEADLINAEGFRVRLPARDGQQLLLDSRQLPGKVSAAGPRDVNPASYDLICLAMQEPQYASPDARELLDAAGKSRVPCMSIMNMPPLPYLQRIPGLDTGPLKTAYTDASVWDSFDPAYITLCSPDPQAIRPPDGRLNMLQVTLPTNFKVAPFESGRHTAILRQLHDEIEAIRYEAGSGPVELPVKLKVYESVFVPLAKWAMLLTGNYRCVTQDTARTIRDAVHNDMEASRSVYAFVCDLCIGLGASPDDLVPFEKYAAAAQGLTRPSSAARALFNGAPDIERADKLVQAIAAQRGKRHPAIDASVALVDERLAANRKAAAAKA